MHILEFVTSVGTKVELFYCVTLVIPIYVLHLIINDTIPFSKKQNVIQHVSEKLWNLLPVQQAEIVVHAVI
jgi:hypothetical protein